MADLVSLFVAFISFHRRIQYHNCKIPFLYEHIMTPFMTRRRRRLLIPIIHLIMRIYTHIVSTPIKFALHSHSISFNVVSCPCHRRSSAISLLLRPLLQNKSFISSYFPRQWVLFARTLYIMYYQSCRFCLICTNTSYVTPGFFHTIYFRPWTPFSLLFSSYAKWPRSLSLVIMRVFTLGLVFCFTLVLICDIN